jgi:hypothetical protein
MKTVESSAVFQPKQWPEKASREDNRKQDPTRTCAQSGVKIEHCSRCPEIHLDRLVWAAPVVLAVVVILKLPALAEYLIPSICGCNLHEGTLGIQVIPFFQKLKEFNYKDIGRTADFVRHHQSSPPPAYSNTTSICV